MFRRIKAGAYLFLATMMLASCGQGAEPTPHKKPVMDVTDQRIDHLSFPSGATEAETDDQTTMAGTDDLALIAHGERLYQRRCSSCHSLDRDRIGPHHRDVYGREAGTVEGFRYSPALRDLDLVWDDATLDAWLENPASLAPGNAMGFRVSKAEERRALIAYLKSVGTE